MVDSHGKKVQEAENENEWAGNVSVNDLKEGI